MNTASLQDIIDSLESLSLDEQDYLLDLIQKRKIEKRREEIAKNAQETFKAVEVGTAKRGTYDDLKSYLLAEDEE